MKHFMIIVFSIMSFVKLRANVPDEWIVSPEKALERLEIQNNNDGHNKNEKGFIKKFLFGNPNQESLQSFDQSIKSVMSANSNVLNEIKDVPKKRWQLGSIKTELAIEPSGMIGVLGLKGESAVELFWNRKKNKEKSLTLSPADFTTKEVLDATPSTKTIELDEDMSAEEIRMQIRPIIASAANGHEQTDADDLEQQLMGKATKVQGLLRGLGQRPENSPWWFYQFQIEAKIKAKGPVAQGVNVGGNIRIRLQWRKIEKIAPKMVAKALPSKMNSPFHTLISDLSEDLNSIDGRMFRNTPYDLEIVKIGVGFELGGNIAVASLSGQMIGAVYFRKDHKIPQPTLKNLPEEDVAEGSILFENKLSPANVSLAKLMNIPYTKSKNSDYGLFQFSRHKMRRALKRSAAMAHFFAEKGSFFMPKSWELNTIGLEFELILSGDVGFGTLKGKSVIEMYIIKQEGQGV